MNSFCKKNKWPFLFIVLVSMAFVNNSIKIANKSKFSSDITSFDNYLNDTILGEWVISGTKSKNSQTKCNTCPKIEFKNDQTVVFKGFKSAATEFKWQLKKDTMFFSYSSTSNEKKSPFMNTPLKVKLNSFKDYIELEFRSVSKDCTYLLRRGRI